MPSNSCTSNASPCPSGGVHSRDLQPPAAEPLRGRDHFIGEAQRHLLRQAQGAEAVPVPVHEESQSTEVHQVPWCKESV